MPRVRLGVALLVEGEQAREIDGLRRALGDPTLGRIEPHITLVPPINVPEAAYGAVEEVLARAGESTAPFSVVLGPPNTFWPASPVAYLPCAQGGDDVVAIMDKVFKPPVWKARIWPYVPHVTLAEIQDQVRLEAAMAALVDFEARVGFDRVYLLRQTAPHGRWERDAEIALVGQPHVIGRGGLERTITS